MGNKMTVVTGDYVEVIAGGSKGVRGKVIRVFPKTNKLIVEGANIRKKHVKPNPQLNKQGGIESFPAPIHRSNVMLVNEATGRPSRVGVKFEGVESESQKVRYFKDDDSTVKANESKG